VQRLGPRNALATGGAAKRKLIYFNFDSDNNIAAHAGTPASTDNLQLFATAKELAKLAADWPASRLVETWNSFAGVAPFDDLKPVKKFTNRKLAISRIWAAVQRLSPDTAQPARDAAPASKRATKSATKAPRCRQGCHVGRDHGDNRLAEAHRSRVREHLGQQGRREDRVREERCWGAHLPHREVAQAQAGLPPNAASGSRPGRPPERQAFAQMNGETFRARVLLVHTRLGFFLRCHRVPIHKVLPTPCGLLVAPAERVGINVGRHANGGMPQSLGHGCQVHAIGQ